MQVQAFVPSAGPPMAPGSVEVRRHGSTVGFWMLLERGGCMCASSRAALKKTWNHRKPLLTAQYFTTRPMRNALSRGHHPQVRYTGDPVMGNGAYAVKPIAKG